MYDQRSAPHWTEQNNCLVYQQVFLIQTQELTILVCEGARGLSCFRCNDLPFFLSTARVILIECFKSINLERTWHIKKQILGCCCGQTVLPRIITYNWCQQIVSYRPRLSKSFTHRDTSSQNKELVLIPTTQRDVLSQGRKYDPGSQMGQQKTAFKG